MLAELNQSQIKARETRGQGISKAKESQVSRIDPTTYRVLSQSGNGAYLVSLAEDRWVCECPDYKYRAVKCKHIYAVEFSTALRNEVQAGAVIEPLTMSVCKFCGSTDIVKDSLRHNKYGDIQRYRCGNCGKRFSFNIGFEKMRATPQVITSAMQLYFTGESLRNVQKFLILQGVNISHVAVYKWIIKYVKLMGKYLEQIKPNVSDTWRADELYVKIKGDMKYLFALMDDQTRFWIAQEVAETKYEHDAGALFRRGKELAGKKPLTIITDGLQAYHIAYKKEFWTTHSPRTKHIQHISARGDLNNNKMERMNGEVRDREKVMRGLKKKDTPAIKGYQIFHNYVRPHEALDGETPADRCGIKVKGDNKWLTIIQNASQQDRKPLS
ncbi:MAG: DDE-type integrase/transposase/recombinase [Promethearchaeati archaeon SRVP18_Atabeyarchaeia-1]